MTIIRKLKKHTKNISSFYENIKKNETSKKIKYYLNGEKIINNFLDLKSKISFYILLINFENIVQKFCWIKNFLNIKKKEKQICKVFLEKKHILKKKEEIIDYSSTIFTAILPNTLEKSWASRITDWQEDQIKTNTIYDLHSDFFEKFPVNNVFPEKKTNFFYKKAKIILKGKVSQKINNLKKSTSRNKQAFFQKYKLFLIYEKISFKKEEFLKIKIKTLKFLNFKEVEKKKSVQNSKSYSSGILIKKNNFLKNETIVCGLGFKRPLVNQIFSRDLFYQRSKQSVNTVGNSKKEILFSKIQKKLISKAPALISTYFLNKEFKTKKSFGKKMPIIFKFIHFRTKFEKWTKQFNPLGDIFILGEKFKRKSNRIVY